MLLLLSLSYNFHFDVSLNNSCITRYCPTLNAAIQFIWIKFWLAFKVVYLKSQNSNFIDILAYRNFWTLEVRLSTLDSGHWTLDGGLRTLDSGFWTLDAGRWSLHFGHYTLDGGLWTLDTVSEHCFTVSLFQKTAYCFAWLFQNKIRIHFLILLD